jgi:ankyrin repeat protein
LVHFLLCHGADPNANDIVRRRALEIAASGAAIPMIEALLHAGAHLKGRCALQTAARDGRLDVIALFLERGVDIDKVSKNEDLGILDYNDGIKNALCEAAWREQTAVVEMLLGRGADMYIKDTKGRSAVELAKMGKHESCIEILKTCYAIPVSRTSEIGRFLAAELQMTVCVSLFVLTI